MIVRLAVLLVAIVGALAAGAAADSAAAPTARAAATCADYDTQAEAQQAGDTRDGDGDGVLCESLPCPCSDAAGGSGDDPAAEPNRECERRKRSVPVRFSRRRWPNISNHISDVRSRYPAVLHIDRAGADENRRRATRGIPTKRNYDRDEYPPAVSEEGGAGADVRYVRSAENRSAGAFLGGRLRPYCDGQPFRMIVGR